MTYSWQIMLIKCYPEVDGNTDVVFEINWRREAASDGFVADVYGSQAITLDASAPFTPYADLTEAQVIAWLEEAMGAEALAAIDAQLDAHIQKQINPTVLTPPLPWVAA